MRAVTPVAWLAVCVAPAALAYAAVVAPSWDVRVPWLVATAIALLFGLLVITTTRVINYMARSERRARAEIERLRLRSHGRKGGA